MAGAADFLVRAAASSVTPVGGCSVTIPPKVAAFGGRMNDHGFEYDRARARADQRSGCAATVVVGVLLMLVGAPVRKVVHTIIGVVGQCPARRPRRTLGQQAWLRLSVPAATPA